MRYMMLLLTMKLMRVQEILGQGNFSLDLIKRGCSKHNAVGLLDSLFLERWSENPLNMKEGETMTLGLKTELFPMSSFLSFTFFCLFFQESLVDACKSLVFLAAGTAMVADGRLRQQGRWPRTISTLTVSGCSFGSILRGLCRNTGPFFRWGPVIWPTF